MDDSISSLLGAKSAVLADVDLASGPTERLLVRSDLTGTMQLYELLGHSELRQVTSLPEPVSTGTYVAGGRRAVIAVDTGGDERNQLYLLDLEAAATRPAQFADLVALTEDPKYGHHVAGISPDGRLVAYLSNKANGVDFDVWLYDLELREHRCMFSSGAYCQPASGFSPDGRFLSVSRPGPRPLDADMLLVEVATGEVMVPVPHPGEAAQVGAPAWVNPTTFYASSNVGRDFAAVVRYEIGVGETTTLPGTGEGSDAQVLTSGDGSGLAVIENRGGASEVRLLAADAPGEGQEVPFAERGVVTHYTIPEPIFSADGGRLYYTLSTPRAPSDVWVYDVKSGETHRLTASPSAVPLDRLAAAELAQVESFDGERVPLFIFRPSQPHPDGQRRGEDPRRPRDAGSPPVRPGATRPCG